MPTTFEGDVGPDARSPRPRAAGAAPAPAGSILRAPSSSRRHGRQRSRRPPRSRPAAAAAGTSSSAPGPDAGARLSSGPLPGSASSRYFGRGGRRGSCLSCAPRPGGRSRVEAFQPKNHRRRKTDRLTRCAAVELADGASSRTAAPDARAARATPLDDRLTSSWRNSCGDGATQQVGGSPAPGQVLVERWPAAGGEGGKRLTASTPRATSAFAVGYDDSCSTARPAKARRSRWPRHEHSLTLLEVNNGRAEGVATQAEIDLGASCARAFCHGE